MADALVLSNQDFEELRSLLRWRRGRSQNMRGWDTGHRGDEYVAPEVYVAKTPAEGISAPSGTTSGTATGTHSYEDVQFAKCPIFQVILTPEGKYHLQAIYDLYQYVFSLSDVPGNIWVLVVRDKGGIWWAVYTAPDAWVAISAAAPHLATLKPGSVPVDGVVGAKIFVWSAKIMSWEQYPSFHEVGAEDISGGWTEATGYKPILLYSPSFEPMLGEVYRATYLTTDNNGVEVWARAPQPPTFIRVEEGATGTGSNDYLPISVTGLDNTGPTIVEAWPCQQIQGSPLLGPGEYNGAESRYAWAYFESGIPPAYGTSYRAYLLGVTDSPPIGSTGTGTSEMYNVWFVPNHIPLIPVDEIGTGTSYDPGLVLVAEPILTIDATTINLGPPFQPDGYRFNPKIRPTSPAFTEININYGGMYAGATGPDGIGNIFLGGINGSVGGTGQGGILSNDFGRET